MVESIMYMLSMVRIIRIGNLKWFIFLCLLNVIDIKIVMEDFISIKILRKCVKELMMNVLLNVIKCFDGSWMIVKFVMMNSVIFRLLIKFVDLFLWNMFKIRSIMVLIVKIIFGKVIDKLFENVVMCWVLFFIFVILVFRNCGFIFC